MYAHNYFIIARGTTAQYVQCMDLFRCTGARSCAFSEAQPRFMGESSREIPLEVRLPVDKHMHVNGMRVIIIAQGGTAQDV